VYKSVLENEAGMLNDMYSSFGSNAVFNALDFIQLYLYIVSFIEDVFAFVLDYEILRKAMAIFGP
jgi:hypothetical protein